MECKDFRELLREYVPNYTNLDAPQIARFRRSLATEIFKEDSARRDLGQDELDSLQKVLEGKRNISLGAHLEFSALDDDPITRVNFREMLRKLMQEDSDQWAVTRLLQNTASTLKGFDYRVRRDNMGAPTGIVWMTATMRRNAVLHGEVLFLDAQKRQMNDSGWPYKAAVIKNSEFKPRVAAESLHLQEDTPSYSWLLTSMQSMEPMFQLTKVSIIFGDEGISDELPRLVGAPAIKVFGDEYHLFREVWKKHFGETLFSLVRDCLLGMWHSRTESEWEENYQSALQVPGIAGVTRHMQYLANIHQKKERYAGFIRKHHLGNLGLNGSAAAEQNHSSITQRLGKGGVMPLSKNIERLLTRQQDIARQDCAAESKHQRQIMNFRSQEENEIDREIDRAAYSHLSKHACEHLFLKHSFCKYKHQSVTVPTCDPRFIYVHAKRRKVSHLTLSEARLDKNIRVLEKDGICNCWWKRAHLIQCHHELSVVGFFNHSSYASRWLNKQGLMMTNREYSLSISDDLKKDNDVPLTDAVENYYLVHGQPEDDQAVDAFDQDVSTPSRRPKSGNMVDDMASPSPRHVRSPSASMPTIFSFAGLQRKQLELARTADGDNHALTSAIAAVERMTHLIRNGQRNFTVEVGVPETGPGKDPITGLSLNPGQDPVRATSRIITNTTQLQRKRSAIEMNSAGQNSYTKRSRVSQRSRATDERSHLGSNTRGKGKHCGLCRDKGHQVNACPRVTKWGHVPLSKDPTIGKNQRLDFIKTLDERGRYSTIPRDPRLTLVDDVPSKMGLKGLVVQQRMMKVMYSPSMTETSDIPGNYCFVCTCLGDSGNPIEMFTRFLLKTEGLQGYLHGSGREQIITNAMERPDAVSHPPNCSWPPAQSPQNAINLGEGGGINLHGGATMEAIDMDSLIDTKPMTRPEMQNWLRMPVDDDKLEDQVTGTL